MSAYEQLSKYSFDACFIGCNGIDLDFGISTRWKWGDVKIVSY